MDNSRELNLSKNEQPPLIPVRLNPPSKSMVNMTSFEVAQNEAKHGPKSKATVNADDRETGKDGLHHKIINWCNSQWPQVKFIHARTDKKSTIDLGAPDFVLFLPNGRTAAIECKAKGGKITTDQWAWHNQLEKLGHQLWFVYNIDEFKTVVSTLKSPNPKD